MEDKDRNKLRKNRVDLVRGLIVEEELLGFLMSNNILTDAMMEEISVKDTKSKKAGSLLDLLPRRGPYAFRAFVEALVETEQGHMADKLDRDIADRYRQIQQIPADHYPENNPTRPLHSAAVAPAQHSDKVIPKEEILPTDSIFPNVNKIQDADRNLIRRVVGDPEANYTMEKIPRGRCIILNIDKFYKESKKKDRDGSYSDVTNLTQVFQKLHFEVVLWDNLTKQEILDHIKTEKKNKAHHDSNAFIMAMLSHGKEDIIYAIDGGEIRISTEIVDQFGGEKCPALLNKPKVFFIQACQGGGTSIGVVPDDAGDIPHPAEVEDSGEIIKDLEPIHEKADILVVAGTVPGYKAWRNVIQGSWFVSDLTLALVQYAHMNHLEEIITTVTRYVSGRTRDNTGHKQICQKKGQLRRNLFFLPGYSNPNS